MIAPYLRQAEVELDLWDDTKISPGSQWRIEIRRALEKAGVAVAIVSPDFLASTFIMEHELPVIIRAAEDGGVQLLWLYVSAAGWEETPLARFQAAHDTNVVLDQRPVPEQNEILKSVAQKIKAAALLDTTRFQTLK